MRQLLEGEALFVSVHINNVCPWWEEASRAPVTLLKGQSLPVYLPFWVDSGSQIYGDTHDILEWSTCTPDICMSWGELLHVHLTMTSCKTTYVCVRNRCGSGYTHTHAVVMARHITRHAIFGPVHPCVLHTHPHVQSLCSCALRMRLVCEHGTGATCVPVPCVCLALLCVRDLCAPVLTRGQCVWRWMCTRLPL